MNTSTKCKSISTCLNIFKYNIKILFSLNVIIAGVMILLTPVIFSLKLLDYMNIATVGELYLSIIGIILIPYMINIESKTNMVEIVYSKRTSQWKIILIRTFIMMIFMFLCILGIMCLAKVKGSSFNLWKVTLGIWISANFLGMIGFTVVNITNNLSMGYLVSFAYYFIEFFTKGKYTKKLYLFSLTRGGFEKGKYLILLITLIIFIVNLAFINKAHSNK